MWWKSPAKKTTKSHRIADRAILDYSRVRVKPGMCRDYPRAVLVQVAPTLYLEDDRGMPFIYSSARTELDWSSVCRHHAGMISSFVRALVSRGFRIEAGATFAVGTALTGGPPHRSQRALLTHWAPTSGHDAQSLFGIRVQCSMLDDFHQPSVVDGIEESTDVRVEYPVHFLVNRAPLSRQATCRIPSCAKTRPSRHRRKNCASRNQANTLAREQVTRRPPTLDYGSTHRWIGCVSFIIIIVGTPSCAKTRPLVDRVLEGSVVFLDTTGRINRRHSLATPLCFWTRRAPDFTPRLVRTAPRSNMPGLPAVRLRMA